MSANKVQQIPIVDSDLKVIGLHLWDKIGHSKVRPNTFFIMAGGRGQRLMPLTKDIPKPMMEVAGKPMLQHIIEKASGDGFRKFIISLHYLGHVIENYFGNGERFGVEIHYVKEDTPLGTAGSISLWKEKFQEPIVVTNGDILSEINYSDFLDFHIQQNADATMAVYQHIWKNPFGVVEVDGHCLVGFLEKPVIRNYVNAGIYILSPKIIDSIKTSKLVNMPDIFMRGREAGLNTIVYPIHERWMDVGNPNDLLLANNLNC
jgi:NDP-sugar pyrophosphorylase family protein